MRSFLHNNAIRDDHGNGNPIVMGIGDKIGNGNAKEWESIAREWEGVGM